MFPDRYNYLARIYSPGAAQAAFAAEHTFIEFLAHACVFAAPYKRLNFPEVKGSYITGSAGSGAVPARNAGLKQRMDPQ